MLSPPGFKISVVMEQIPGAFLWFSVFRAAGTSTGVIGLVGQLFLGDAVFTADGMVRISQVGVMLQQVAKKLFPVLKAVGFCC